MTEEEMINHKKLESAFLHCKDKRKRLSKRCQEQQKIIDLQNSALRRKDNFIKKQESQIEKMKCCENCKHQKHVTQSEDITQCRKCFELCNWEFAE